MTYSQCAQWKQPRSSEQIASVRAFTRKVIEAFLEKAGERDWKQLISQVMTTYDQQSLGGKLAKTLAQQGIRIHVRVSVNEADEPTKKENDAARLYSLHVDVREMKRMEKDQVGRIMNGIQCKDMIELLQVSIESQIARLVADTVCLSSDAATVESDPALRREFASSLFGHTFPVILPILSVLPEALLWMISKSLSKREAVVLGQTSRQVRDDLSKPVHGFKVIEYVDIKTVLDPSRGWTRREGLIGNFTAFYVSTLDDLVHLPLGTLRLELRLPKEAIVTSAMLSRLSLLTHLDFGRKFDQPVEEFELPASLTHLTFGIDFNQPVEQLKLPASLTHLEFGGDKFNQPVDRIELLTSLTHFQIGGDKSIATLKLPTSLTHLTISGHVTNHSIEHLRMPDSLTHLTFGAYVYIKGSIENLKLPASLTHLELDGNFDQPIDNLKLPASLTHLTVNYHFSQPIENLKLPASLTHLLLAGNLDQPIENLKLPASLTHLEFGGYHPIKNLKLPASLTHLKFYNYNPMEDLKLPASLTHLTVGGHQDGIEARYLPASLTHLYFGRFFPQPAIKRLKLLLPRLVIQIDPTLTLYSRSKIK